MDDDTRIIERKKLLFSFFKHISVLAAGCLALLAALAGSGILDFDDASIHKAFGCLFISLGSSCVVMLVIGLVARPHEDWFWVAVYVVALLTAIVTFIAGVYCTYQAIEGARQIRQRARDPFAPAGIDGDGDGGPLPTVADRGLSADKRLVTQLALGA